MSENEWEAITLFEKNRSGRLMRIEESEQTRFQFEIWFEYTRQAMISLKEGTLLAARNFSTSEKETHYSILELTSMKPIHYALGNTSDGYPGFVMEAARNISMDWTNQEEESAEDTTIIRCIATPTDHEIIESDKGRSLVADSSLPMIGTNVSILSSAATHLAVNKGLSNNGFTLECGKWLVDGKTPILINIEELLRLHFGIFGFTKAGKSNLLSTLIAKIFEKAESEEIPVKIVIFDLMSEYNVLLIDQLFALDNSQLIALGEQTFPESVIQYLASNEKDAELQNKAVQSLIKTSLYPKHLERIKDSYSSTLNSLFTKNKIRLFSERKTTLGQLLNQNEEILFKGNIGGYEQNIRRLVSNLKKDSSQLLTSDLLLTIIGAVETLLNPPDNPPKAHQATIWSSGIDEGGSGTSQLNSNDYLKDINLGIKLTSTAKGNLTSFKDNLEDNNRRIKSSTKLPVQSTTTMDMLLQELNSQNHSSLTIIQSHDPHRLRNFTQELGNALYESRRRNGLIAPLVSFIFDEADEFIPSSTGQNSSYASSNEIAHMLSRRGRKFGLGIGIATQRTTYLNTNIMSQPHTYFVSKLPRRHDRERVQEAFGLSDEMLRQTIKFTIGDWIIASYDATGMTGIPIPIRAVDANERIKTFLSTQS
ncbi:DUF87 domain-containing protein [Methanoculleus sp.]|uniref:helicase HerA domain-containing protein n=1 Tax=Methanoculleus sp. TaxID=90427 RepID=UPI0025CBA40F|nr:DUF87 domain-containing protein [Methanoculleus sp.]